MSSPLKLSEFSDSEASACSLTILVVDDYSQTAESFAYLLSIENFAVTIAHSGDEALQLFDELRPRVVILDIGMSPLSGFDVARAIRSREHGRRTLLIAITGWAGEQLEKECSAAGFDAYFLKPLNYTELKKLLTWWLKPSEMK